MKYFDEPVIEVIMFSAYEKVMGSLLGGSTDIGEDDGPAGGFM